MFVKLIIFASVLACVALITAAGNKWAWKNVAEPQCNNCKCYYKAPPMNLKLLKSLFAQKRYYLMASKLRLQQAHIRFGKGGMIKTDQDLAAIAPLTFKTYFSRGMKKAYANWTLHDTFTGSVVSGIRRNVMNMQFVTGTSRKIQNMEDSLMGDGFNNLHVLWADETNILFVGCSGSEGYSYWWLTSMSRKLNRMTKQIVLQKISALGFNLKRAIILPF